MLHRRSRPASALLVPLPTRDYGGRARAPSLGAVADRTRLVELIGLGGLLVLAGSLRLPGLMSLPTWTDEVAEIAIALDIADGKALPLTNNHGYVGALWNYILAVAFLLFGREPELPRLVTFAFGLAAVAATYLLGRRIGGPLVGFVAAGLLSVSGVHVLITSRVAWSHSITPLLTTLAVLAVLGVGAEGGPRLALAGLLAGLAAQTHITAIALVPAVAAYVLGCRRAWLRDRWAWAGVAAFLAAYASVIVSNLSGGGMMLRQAGFAGSSFQGGGGLAIVTTALAGRSVDLAGFVATLGGQVIVFARVVSGAIQLEQTPGAFLRDPLVLATGLVLVIGVVDVTRRVSKLPALVLLSFGLVLLAVNTREQVIPNGRFMMPTVPLALALVGAGIVAVARRLRRWPGGSALLALGLAVGLGAASFGRLQERVSDLEDSRLTSRALDRLVEPILADPHAAERVALDPGLEKLWLDAGGNYLTALQYRLRVATIPTGLLADPAEAVAHFLVSPCAKQRAALRRLSPGEGDPLEQRLPAGSSGQPGGAVWVVYVLAPDEEPDPAARVVRYRPPLLTSGRAAFICEGRLMA